MILREDTDDLSYQICGRLEERFRDVSSAFSPIGNIIGIFFHDLVIHFTGIIIHRNSIKDYGGLVEFPWINKSYAVSPTSIETLVFPQKARGLIEAVKHVGLVPVCAGQSIPLGYVNQRYVGKAVKIALAHPGWSQCFVPDRKAQLSLFEELVLEFCKDYEIKNSRVVSENWKRYVNLHTTDKQVLIKKKGVLVGTRNNLHNRKLAINFLQQGKEVIGFTHGEISNHVLDEPVYGYSDKTLCTTLVDYGSFRPETVSFPPIIKPVKESRRSSPVVEKIYRRNETIEYRDLRKTQNLLIPTIYQQNFLYGPKHAYESHKYYRWHQALEQCVPNLTVKLHPKARFRPKFVCGVEERMLEESIEDYDVLMFDYFATGAVHAIFSDKPVIYFDIGLRSLNRQFAHDLRQRCTVVNIDFDAEWEEQIQTGLEQYEEDRRTWSNTGLERYSLCNPEEFSLMGTIFDIMTEK